MLIRGDKKELQRRDGFDRSTAALHVKSSRACAWRVTLTLLRLYRHLVGAMVYQSWNIRYRHLALLRS
jgi:hypothetical protein